MTSFKEYYEEQINEAKDTKLFKFKSIDVPDAKLIKVGETFIKDGVHYEVTKWSNSSIEAVLFDSKYLKKK